MLEEILFRYQNLLHKIDRACRQLEEYYAAHLVCSPGCSQCCEVERTVLSIEAFVVEQQLRTLSPQRLKKISAAHRHDDKNCHLLWKGLCSIYNARPIICRTHGLPIFYREAEITFIDYCRLNFKKLSRQHTFNGEFVLDMNDFNVELISIDQQYTEQVLGKLWHPGNRISLKSILSHVK